MCASFAVIKAFYVCWFTFSKTCVLCCIYGATCAVFTLRITCSVLGESTVLFVIVGLIHCCASCVG